MAAVHVHGERHGRSAGPVAGDDTVGVGARDSEARLGSSSTVSATTERPGSVMFTTRAASTERSALGKMPVESPVYRHCRGRSDVACVTPGVRTVDQLRW
ncbi:MAG: hypothetical protein CL424_12275 [Acidimicrobiaceae bacterium]|nr:hypothetical protein [Acidimicrobiaceae bacterium]